MLEVFLATIDPLLTLFTCMALGFVLKKAKILPENATKVLSRLETWVFLPALSFKTMSQYCRIELLGDNIVNMLFGCFSIAVCIKESTHLLLTIRSKMARARCCIICALKMARGAMWATWNGSAH